MLYSPANVPTINAYQNTVEDWIIENRATESHVFHIHNVHFLLLQRDNVDVPPNEMQYRDTAQVQFWASPNMPYHSIKIRVDFTQSNTGTFIYRCNILDHEDRGMAATVNVLPCGQAGLCPTISHDPLAEVSQ